jgi:hypothetical protein
VTTGARDSAFGYNVLHSDTTGSYDTASGVGALGSNTTGSSNTASGNSALFGNTVGYQNTADGFHALTNNITGYGNTASGFETLDSNGTGSQNTASGFSALHSNTMGNDNIGLGFNAGYNIVTGSNNIEIGSFGSSDESDTIRIGAQDTQTATYVAGIYGTGVSSTDPVCVLDSGQLGVCASSARYKRDIREMRAASSGLMRLRPVMFRYRSDPKGQRQYGLIAEEVARVYPELVDYDHNGKPLTVRYLELNAMLLNELQKQDKQLQEQTSQLQTQARKTQELMQRLESKDRQLAAQQREIDSLKQQSASINALSQRLAALEDQVRTSATSSASAAVVGGGEYVAINSGRSISPQRVTADIR